MFDLEAVGEDRVPEAVRSRRHGSDLTWVEGSPSKLFFRSPYNFFDREYPFSGQIISVFWKTDILCQKGEIGEDRVPEAVYARRHGSDMTGGCGVR